MKIRNGFVSNSSSSSFTCDICGTTESGYDASAHDVGMETCRNGHTFCESDKIIPTLTTEEKKNILINAIRPYWKGDERQSKIDAYNKMTDAETEDTFEEENREDGVFSCFCPLCSLKKVSYNDRESYLIKMTEKTTEEIDEEIKSKYSSYTEFKNFINPPKPTI